MSRELLAERARQVLTGAADDAHVLSPCISVCTMSADNAMCLGCWRTLDEIAAWSRMDAPAKRAVWTLITRRAGIDEPEASP